MTKKNNNCKTCSKERITGLKGYCRSCYSTFLKKKEKEKKQKEQKAKRTEKKKEQSSIKIGSIQRIINNIIRLNVSPSDVCITCNQPFNNVCKLNAGHCFVAGKTSTRFYLRNIYPQCSCCNLKQHKDGNVGMYLILQQKYGTEFMQKLYKMSNVPYKFNTTELKEIRDKSIETITELNKTDDFVIRRQITDMFITWQESTEWFKNIEHLI